MKMNFKIENNYIHITNYPSIEKHFEEMAAKGWLINRIIGSSIFIYKRIKPEAFDFSISPYEVETEYTKKTKSELAEFQNVVESVGWNYAAKSSNLHVYYKEKGSDALDIQTDEEEEFRILETIGKRYVKSLWVQIPLFLFLAISNIRQLLTGVEGMRDALPQLLSIMLPFTILTLVIEAYSVNKFLKENKRNIELGESIEFSKSNFYINKMSFLVTYIIFIIFILYMLYEIIILKNRFLLIAMIPITLTLVIVALYNIFIKPSKMTRKGKKKSFVFTIMLSIMIPILLFGFFIMDTIGRFKDSEIPNIGGYKVITVNDFYQTPIKQRGTFRRQTSLLIPTSYEYYSYNDEIYERTNTEYSKALTENLAKTLVQRYIKQAEKQVERDRQELEIYFREDIYDDFRFGERAGISLEEFNRLKNEDIKVAIETTMASIKERAIIKEDENLWNADEVYFLNYNKTEILVRQDKEVFYIDTREKDLSKPENIKIVKECLLL